MLAPSRLKKTQQFLSCLEMATNIVQYRRTLRKINNSTRVVWSITRSSV